jgi:hypothetical protein
MLAVDASRKERRYELASQSAAGLLAVVALSMVLLRAAGSVTVSPHAPTVVRVGMRHAPAPKVEAVVQPVEVAHKAPVEHKKPVHKVVAPKPAPVAEPSVAEDEPVIIRNTGVPLEAPPIPDMPPPPAPPENVSDDIPNPYAATVQPGGSTLVLALQVNSDGEVLRTKVLIQSGDPLKDLTFLMAAQRQVLHDLDPPVPEGQTAWLVRAINFQTPNTVLP